jgi:ribonuclease VapC
VLVAIIDGEPEARKFSGIMAASHSLRMSAANYLETAMVVDKRKNAAFSGQLDELVENYGVVLEPVSVEHAYAARQAFQKFGKGMGHPAQLNFGDCFAYALAKGSGEPLLFKGDDFPHTDIIPAIPK